MDGWQAGVFLVPLESFIAQIEIIPKCFQHFKKQKRIQAGPFVE